jgi:putative flippase GtrA
MISLNSPGLHGQALRFGIGGGLVTLLGASVYWVLAAMLGTDPLLANLTGHLASVLVGFRLHGRWSFRGVHDGTDLTRANLRFLLASLVPLALNTLWASALFWLPAAPRWLPILPMICVTPAASFLVNRLWVFRATPAAR